MLNGENRREYFRLNLIKPLCASMSVVKIGDTDVSLGSTKICIENISAGGICILTDLQLPLERNLVLRFVFKILEENVSVRGTIVWHKPALKNLNRYGIRFELDDSAAGCLIKTVNDLQIRQKNGRKIEESCSLCNIESVKCICKIKAITK